MEDGLDNRLPVAGRVVEARPLRVPAPVILAGRYVTLRPLDPADAPALYEALAGDDQESLQRYTADPVLARVEDASALIAAKLTIPNAVYFACVDALSQSIGGFVCLMRVDSTNRVLEIGNVLYAERLRRSRAGTEAIYLLLRHAIEDLGFRRIEWKCNDNNAGSRHAALRYGFNFEGVFRQHMIVKGRNRDTAWYSLVDREWPMRRESFEAWLAPENFTQEGRQITALAQLNGVGGS